MAGSEKHKKQMTALQSASDGAIESVDQSTLDPGHAGVGVSVVRDDSATIQAHAELQQAFDFFNTELFQGQIPPCLITMQRERRTMGYYAKGRFLNHATGERIDEIAMNPRYFPVMSLLGVLQTLVHEMVHAWQEHFGTPSRRCYHNREWARKMESIGLMPSDTGLPGGRQTGEKMMDYAIVGSPFMQATEKLLASGFAITWWDRRAEEPPPNIEPVDLKTLATTDAWSEDDPLGANAEPTGTLALESPPAPATPLAPQDEIRQFTPMPSQAERHNLADQLVTSVPGNRSNRLKYRCDGCGQQAWGKPGLKLLCGQEGCEARQMQA